MDKRLKILFEVYKKVYSELGEDFDKLKERKDQWFLDFEMSDKRQEEILEEVCNKYKLNKATRRIISINYWLGCSPKSVSDDTK